MKTTYATRLPAGRAKADYSRPCPGCDEAPRKGQEVTKVTLPDGTAWWHTACRKAEVERQMVLSGATYASQKPSEFRRKSVRRRD